LIRQLYRIKQVGFIQDYIDKFCGLIDQLQAYSHNIDPLYYTTRFVDGLRDEIEYVIIVQRPHDLDIVCYLALLQEESSASHKDGTILDSTLPLRRPPMQVKVDSAQDDKSKGSVHKGHSIEDKLAALSSLSYG
jgi:hypothetical protein